MNITNLLTHSSFLIFHLSLSLHALPEDLDVFIDFENETGSGNFFIGESPNSVQFINFNIESTSDTGLNHSGIKSLVLIPGEEGIIRFERGVNLLQFYAAETTGAGRIELKEDSFHFVLTNGLVEGLPTSISPNVNPILQDFISYSGDPDDTSDLNTANGVKVILIRNVTGQFALDDLGFTYAEGPPNNTVYFDFGSVFGDNIKFIDPIVLPNITIGTLIIGESPVTATFTDGAVSFVRVPFLNHTLADFGTWEVENGITGTITFETPAAKVQFYAASLGEGDAEINIFDTEDNLLTSTKNIPQNISLFQRDEFPFDVFDFSAEELNAPGGIGKITYTNGPNEHNRGYQPIALDDFGFTPIETDTANLLPDDLLINNTSVVGADANSLYLFSNFLDKEIITFSAEYSLRPDRELFVTGSHPDLGNWDVIEARKLHKSLGNTWSANLAVESGIELQYRFISRSLNVADYCDPNNFVEESDLFSLSVPARSSESASGKTIFYHSSWNQAIIRYRDGEIWVEEVMTRIGSGREDVSSEFLYFIDDVGEEGKPIEFILHDGAGNEDRSIYDDFRDNHYLTELNTFYLQNGQIFNYKPPAVVSSSELISIFVNSSNPGIIPSRQVNIYLPRNYAENTLKRYPVLYAHDGEDLFGPNDSNVKYTADKEIRQGRLREFIIVGIEANDNRRLEYAPPGQNLLLTSEIPFNSRGVGDSYLNYIINDVRPIIDSEYRTLNDPIHTLIMGGSLGGLISAYAGWEYFNVFGQVGLLTPSFWSGPQFVDDIESGEKRNIRIYMDTGTIMDNWEVVWNAYNLFLADDYTLNDDLKMVIGCGDRHGIAIEERSPDAFNFLLNIREEPNSLDSLSIEPPIVSGDGFSPTEFQNIQHQNSLFFDQVLMTGPNVIVEADPDQITRVSYIDEDDDIVQVEFYGAGTLSINLDAATFAGPAFPVKYNQEVEYVKGHANISIEGADSSTYLSVFSVGSINAVNQTLFPEGEVYDAMADIALLEITDSSGFGGLQLSNTEFRRSTGKTGIDARGVPIAVRLTIGDIDASGDAVPHLLIGNGSFTVPAGNPGLRITGGDLDQTNGASTVVAESGSTTTGFETLISQNNFKSDNTPQPTQSIAATFANEDGDEITIAVEELTIE